MAKKRHLHGNAEPSPEQARDFNTTWRLLAMLNAVDAFGGSDWNRVFMEWRDAGMPTPVEHFIRRAANRPASGERPDPCEAPPDYRWGG